MAFYGEDFFSGSFFKKEFYGKTFFQGDYFASSTIAHPIGESMSTATALLIGCNRTVTGTHDVGEYLVTVDGTENIVTLVEAVGNTITLTLTDSVLAGEVVRVWHFEADTNNVGIVSNRAVTNELV